MIRLDFNKTATISCSNAQVNFEALYDLAFFKDPDGFYYDYTLFTLAEVLKLGQADDFYKSLENKNVQAIF